MRDTRTMEQLKAELAQTEKDASVIYEKRGVLLKPADDLSDSVDEPLRAAEKIRLEQLRALGLTSFATFKKALAKHLDVEPDSLDELRGGKNEQYTKPLAQALWAKLEDETPHTAEEKALRKTAESRENRARNLRYTIEASEAYRVLSAKLNEAHAKQRELRDAIEKARKREDARFRRADLKENPEMGKTDKVRAQLKAMLSGETKFTYDGKKIT